MGPSHQIEMKKKYSNSLSVKSLVHFLPIQRLHHVPTQLLKDTL